MILLSPTGNGAILRNSTLGTETSQYQQEKKSIEIPLVVVSECGLGFFCLRRKPPKRVFSPVRRIHL